MNRFLFNAIICKGGISLKLPINALAILGQWYFARDNNGKLIEDAKGLVRRVAKYVATDSIYDSNKMRCL